MRTSLADLKRLYVDEARPLPVEVEAHLRADDRAGAQAILRQIERRRRDNRAEGQRLRRMLRFEHALWSSGLSRVAGIDEAGMSPLAGPVAAAAVVLAPGSRIPYVDDSKKLDPDTRRELAVVIRREAIACSVAFVEVFEIDTVNIYWAGILAMRRALEGLGCAPEHLLLDARRLKDVALPQQAIVHGDARSLSIAAASILAKTSRDARMTELDIIYPGYGFARHKGYPVREHYAALDRLGACPIHRTSFGPVRRALGLPPLHSDRAQSAELAEPAVRE